MKKGLHCKSCGGGGVLFSYILRHRLPTLVLALTIITITTVAIGNDGRYYEDDECRSPLQRS